MFEITHYCEVKKMILRFLRAAEKMQYSIIFPMIMELTAYKDFDINNEFIVMPFHHHYIYVQFAKFN